jgi:hypothetical protein
MMFSVRRGRAPRVSEVRDRVIFVTSLDDRNPVHGSAQRHPEACAGATLIENPRVGGSIPPLATIQIKALIENDTDVKVSNIYWTLFARHRHRSYEMRPTAIGHDLPVV